MFDVRIVGSVVATDGGEEIAEELRIAIMNELNGIFSTFGLFEVKVFTIGERYEVYPPGWKEYSSHGAEDE